MKKNKQKYFINYFIFSITISAIFFYSCKQNNSTINYELKSQYEDSINYVEFRKNEKIKDSIMYAFHHYDMEILKKTGSSVCDILQDIRFEYHINNEAVSKKFNGQWTTKSYEELDVLNKKTTQKKIKKYKLSLDEYVDMVNRSTDFCHTTY